MSTARLVPDVPGTDLGRGLGLVVAAGNRGH